VRARLPAALHAYAAPCNATSFLSLPSPLSHVLVLRCRIGAEFWATPQAIVHEMGHNLYMAHAGGTNSEGVFDDYFDDSGTMG
jgi:hypothetical protein